MAKKNDKRVKAHAKKLDIIGYASFGVHPERIQPRAVITVDRGAGLSLDEKLAAVIRAHLRECPGSGRQGLPSQHVERTRFLTTALAGEAGEMLNLIKKQWRGDYDNTGCGQWMAKFVGELVDVANYLDMLCEHLGIDRKRLQLAKLKDVEDRPTYKGEKLAYALSPSGIPGVDMCGQPKKWSESRFDPEGGIPGRKL